MKVRELIEKLEILERVSSQVPGRAEDEVFVLGGASGVINPESTLCTIEEVYSDESLFQHAGILVRLGRPFRLTWPDGKRVPIEGQMNSAPLQSNCEEERGEGPRLRDLLTAGERDELANVMRNEPVHPGNTISYVTARSLNVKGLIRRQGVRWVACWERIKEGRPLPSV